MNDSEILRELIEAIARRYGKETLKKRQNAISPAMDLAIIKAAAVLDVQWQQVWPE